MPITSMIQVICDILVSNQFLIAKEFELLDINFTTRYIQENPVFQSNVQEQPIFPRMIRFKHLSHKITSSHPLFSQLEKELNCSLPVSTLIQQSDFWVFWWKNTSHEPRINPLLSELKVKMSSKSFLGWLLGIVVRRVPWLLDLKCILAKQETAPNIHFWFTECNPC